MAQDAPQDAQQNAPLPEHAWVKPNHPDRSQVYCSGFVSDQKVADDTYLISGEQSNIKISFAQGDYVYINKGMNQGVREGDRYQAVRPESDPDKLSWFRWQKKLMKAMGTSYSDLGEIRVVKVQPTVSIGIVTRSCAYMQRGDIVRPFVERPVGPFKDASTFDHFAPLSGKPVAMVVASKDWAQLVGKNDTIYVNLGTNQGVKPGDYFRIFRYQGSHSEAAPIEKNYQYKMFGYGSTPQRYSWNDLPREILGEGIVLNASHNSSTVLITFSSADIYAGDYVEVE